MLNDITIVKCEVMSHLVRLRGKDAVQCAHCALEQRSLDTGLGFHFEENNVRVVVARGRWADWDRWIGGG